MEKKIQSLSKDVQNRAFQVDNLTAAQVKIKNNESQAKKQVIITHPFSFCCLWFVVEVLLLLRFLFALLHYILEVGSLTTSSFLLFKKVQELERETFQLNRTIDTQQKQAMRLQEEMKV